MIKRLRDSLAKARTSFKGRLDELVRSGKNKDEILEDLMEVLILADTGVQTSEKIIQTIRAKSKKSDNLQNIKLTLKTELISLLSLYQTEEPSGDNGTVTMFVGVNGGGKTTSLVKMARRCQREGKQTVLVAADTFRAAAQEQLAFWGKKLNIPVIRGQHGADPAAVVFDAIQSFKSRQADVLLIDTAGRVHTNINLMQELEKIKRVAAREIEGAPHDIILVLDASTGQNAIRQAQEFRRFSGLTGIILTKLDGTAKGGSVISVVDNLRLPIRYVGIGETENDLVPFTPTEFVEALLS